MSAGTTGCSGPTRRRHFTIGTLALMICGLPWRRSLRFSSAAKRCRCAIRPAFSPLAIGRPSIYTYARTSNQDAVSRAIETAMQRFGWDIMFILASGPSKAKKVLDFVCGCANWYSAFSSAGANYLIAALSSRDSHLQAEKSASGSRPMPRMLTAEQHAICKLPLSLGVPNSKT